MIDFDPDHVLGVGEHFVDDDEGSIRKQCEADAEYARAMAALQRRERRERRPVSKTSWKKGVMRRIWYRMGYQKLHITPILHTNSHSSHSGTGLVAAAVADGLVYLR